MPNDLLACPWLGKRPDTWKLCYVLVESDIVEGKVAMEHQAVDFVEDIVEDYLLANL